MSSSIEDRIGRELQDLAARLAPGELRPLREPRAGTARARGHWLAPVAAMAAVALVAGGLAVARQTLGSSPARPSHRQVDDPPDIAIAGMPSSEQTSLIKLISASTGRVVKIMSGAGAANNVALAPDMKSVFTIPLSSSAPQIYQVWIRNGRTRLVGDGRFPTPSPNSQRVAYGPGTNPNHHVLAVVNLGTGSTLHLDLSSVIGGGAQIDSLTWLGDGTQLIVLPRPASYTLYAQPLPPKAPPANACGQQRLAAGLCLVVVTLRSRQLVARRVVLPGWRLPANKTIINQEIISGDLTSGHSFLIARSGSPAGLVDRVSIHGAGLTVRRVASLPSLAMPVAIAPDGDRIIYQPNGASLNFSGPSWLWVAPMTGGRLGHARLLLTGTPKFQYYQVSW